MHQSLRALQRRLRHCDDSGFTLVEQVVALLVAAMVFLAVAVAAMGGVKASVMSRLNQQAVDILNRSIEQARGMTYAELTMVSSDVSAGDSTITGSPKTWSVPGVGTEAVDYHVTGLVSPHVSTVTANVNNASYTLKRYVTVPASATYDSAGFPTIKRFTAVVSWSIYGKVHTRYDSTLVTDTTRGLALPNYTLRGIGPKTRNVNAGVVVDFGLALHNLGAKDAFDISVSSSNAALTSGWTYYLDDGATDATCTTTSEAADGVRDCGENTLLTDTGANGAIDSGLVEPNKNLYFLAERTAGSTDSGTVTFTTTSVAQPDASGAQHTQTFTLTVSVGTVTAATCPTLTTATAGTGTSTVAFYLTNSPDGNTSTATGNPAARADCTVQTATSMPNYSTDVSGNTTGRYLAAGGNTSATGSQRAQWYYQPGFNMKVNGTGSLTLFVQCVTAGTPTLLVNVGTMKTSTGTNFAAKETGSVTLASCPTSGWQQVDVPLSMVTGTTSWTVSKNGTTSYLGVRVWNTASSPAVRLAYDWSTYVSYMVLAVNP